MEGRVERIKRLMEHLGMNAATFSKHIVFNQSNLSKILRGERKIPANLTELILDKTNVRRDWLMYGNGPMFEGEQAPDVPEYLSNAVRSEDVTDLVYAAENKHGGIFYRDQKGQLYMSAPHVAFAAYAQYPNDADSLEPNGEWGRDVYKVDKVARGRYYSFDIKGDSMDNGMRSSLRDGDRVLARELERDNWRTLRAGDHRYWVIVFGSSVLIKEIAAFDPETGEITCHSLNPSPEYHDFTLNLDNVRFLYYGIKLKHADDDI